MTASETPGAVKQFRETKWVFQQTFLTPLKNLDPFVAAIVAGQGFQSAALTIDQAVFEPKHLIDLMRRHAIPPRFGHDTSLMAAGEKEIRALLLSAFSDWVDFIFIPEPKSFAIFADHDEYATLFANTRCSFNPVVTKLSAEGFEAIHNYERHL